MNQMMILLFFNSIEYNMKFDFNGNSWQFSILASQYNLTNILQILDRLTVYSMNGRMQVFSPWITQCDPYALI